MATEKDINPYLFNLIVSHEAAAMQFMGKTARPDGKVERNLEMARFAIDTLEALQEKTKGNLSNGEKNLLDHTLYQLRMNYVDEVAADKKRADQPQDDAPPEQTPSSKAREQPPDKKPDETANPTPREAE